MADGRKTAWTPERKAAHAAKVKAAWERRKADAEETGKRLRKPMSDEGRKNISRTWTKERRERHSELMSQKWNDDGWREKNEISVTGRRSIKYPPPPFDVTKIEGYDWQNPQGRDVRLYLRPDQIEALDDWVQRCEELERGHVRKV